MGAFYDQLEILREVSMLEGKINNMMMIVIGSTALFLTNNIFHIINIGIDPSPISPEIHLHPILPFINKQECCSEMETIMIGMDSSNLGCS